MRRLSLALAIAASSALFIEHAAGQEIRQPTTFRTVAFDYDSYLQEGATESPSDVPVPSNGNGAAAAPSACGIAAAASSCGCDAGGCGAGGCDTCGCGGCGLGLGLGLGDRLACCELDEPWRLSGLVCCDPVVEVGGWLATGYYNRNNGLFNSHPGKLRLTQGWLYFEKEAGRCDCTWDWGFRLDGMYGTDAQDTQAFGNGLNNFGDPSGWDNSLDHGIYGWALPQAYVELARNDLSIKAGHFFTTIGYEAIPAPDNFFFSHAITMYNSEPFTHTGILAEYAYTDDVTLYGGWTLGWDTAFDQFGSGNNFLGGISMPFGEYSTLSFMTTIGNFGARGDDGYMSSTVVETTLSDRLRYIGQSDWLWVDPVTGGKEQNYGLNNYLIYDYSDCLALGTRFEWWNGDSINPYTPFNSAAPASGNQSYYEVTTGLNFRPTANVVMRPELRYDWSPALNYDIWTFGVDAILTF